MGEEGGEDGEEEGGGGGDGEWVHDWCFLGKRGGFKEEEQIDWKERNVMQADKKQDERMLFT